MFAALTRAPGVVPSVLCWALPAPPLYLDRVLCTFDWEDAHGECHLRCLALVVSDHYPLLLDCSPMPTAHKRFHFEDYWLQPPASSSLDPGRPRWTLPRELAPG
uniref:Endonuclease/exonuclease/phosphatase domain-containing protein n=1 Tax=Aegilops tauschii subsp. strangulata TaxID=200361 RepID=A0A452Y5N7_AEGTS